MSFLAVLTVSIASLLWIRSHYGLRAMLALAWAYSFLLPTMLRINLGGASVEIRQVVMGFAFGCLMVSGQRWLPDKWLWVDTLAVSLFASQLVTEGMTDHIGPSAIVSYTIDWLLPYFFGRLIFQSLDDLPRLTRAAAYVILVLSAAATVESITRVNPMQLVSYGPAALHAPCDMRWGLRRADGPSQHPISFGLMMVFLVPWALQGAAEARSGRGPHWWKYLPWMCGAAVFFSMSRGPQIAVVLGLFGMGFFRFPAWRGRLLAGVAVGALCLGMGREVLVSALHLWSNETGRQSDPLVINGVTWEYSGTNHRILQLLVYEEAALNAGLFGYGVVAMSTTPSTIPYVDPNLELTFHSIDNHYLCFLLSRGYLGTALFIVLGLLVLTALWRPAIAIEMPQSMLAAALFSIMAAVLIVLTTVWFCFAFGCNWLIAAGLAASLREQFNRAPALVPIRLSSNTDYGTRVRKVVPARRLVPGHPASSVDAAGSLSQA